MICFSHIDIHSLRTVLSLYGLQLNEVPNNLNIPYSFWGTPEAGRKNHKLYVRHDTPLHSILHEACHFVCMPAKQRNLDDIDAGGGVMEENACCYLQILLSDHIHGFNRLIHMQNMDEWGYSFRLGSAATWFHEDADDARLWLQGQTIIDQHNHITWRLRD